MNTTTVWILLLASNPACVFLGYLWGRVTRATVEIAEGTMEDEANPVVEAAKMRRRGVTAMQVMAVAMVLIGLATALMGFIFTRNQDRITGCVAGYSNALADTLNERSRPQQQAFDSLDLVMEAVSESIRMSTPENAQRVQRAIQDYVEVRRQTKEALAQNPLPEAPRDACSRLIN